MHLEVPVDRGTPYAPCFLEDLETQEHQGPRSPLKESEVFSVTGTPMEGTAQTHRQYADGSVYRFCGSVPTDDCDVPALGGALQARISPHALNGTQEQIFVFHDRNIFRNWVGVKRFWSLSRTRTKLKATD